VGWVEAHGFIDKVARAGAGVKAEFDAPAANPCLTSIFPLR